MFAVLLNFKHISCLYPFSFIPFDHIKIYMYYAPAYFAFLLRQFCMNPTFSFGKFVSLGSAVGLVFAISVGPFIALDQVF
jgi:alpha-1,3-glucosyltransferase